METLLDKFYIKKVEYQGNMVRVGNQNKDSKEPERKLLSIGIKKLLN